jgi:hypothetical protein
MKGFRAAMAVISLAFGMLAGCNDYNNSIQYNTGATVTNISPTGVAAGSGQFLLTVNAIPANGFQTNSVVRWNGNNMATTFVDTTTLTAMIPANLVTTAGVAYVNVLTPQSGTGNNGLSNTEGFNIYGSPNPLPTLTSVAPNSAPACGTNCANVSVNITVTGTNFLPTTNNGGTLVTFQDLLTPLQQPAALVISKFSSTQITAAIPGTYLANNDTAMIVVVNPPNIPGGGQCPNQTCLALAGGGYSSALNFTIGTGVSGSSAVAEETPAISQDGRYVAYAAQQSQVNQILLKDTCVGVTNGCTASTRMISAAPDGTAGNADSHDAVITPDGRYVAFSSAATNLVEGAPSGRQVYLHDTCIGAANSCKSTTTLISTDPDGSLTGTESILPTISATGRFVAFVAVTPSATPKATAGAKANVVSTPNSGLRQVFVRDTCLGAANCTPKTTRISLTPGDAPADGSKPAGPAISGQAKQIALADGKTATVFTPTVPVDGGVYLAVPKEQ